MKKFRSFLLGSAVGAAYVWMTTTPKGKAFREDALRHGKRIAEDAGAQLMKNETAQRTIVDIERALEKACSAYFSGTVVEKKMQKAVRSISRNLVHKKNRRRKT